MIINAFMYQVTKFKNNHIEKNKMNKLRSKYNKFLRFNLRKYYFLSIEQQFFRTLILKVVVFRIEKVFTSTK